MLKAVLAAAATTLLWTGAAAAHDPQVPPPSGGSVYSSVKVEDCIRYDVFRLGASTACRGPEPFTVTVTDADLRIYLGVVHPEWDAPAKIDLTKISPSFSALPSDLFEWRMSGDRPTALIFRFGYNQGDGRPGEEDLIVVRIDAESPERTCLVGRVGRGGAMNAEARALADRAGSLPCL